MKRNFELEEENSAFHVFVTSHPATESSIVSSENTEEYSPSGIQASSSSLTLVVHIFSLLILSIIRDA